MIQSQQIFFPWASYKVSELSRVLNVSRGKTMTALRRLKLIGKTVDGAGLPADQATRVAATLEAIRLERARVKAQASERRAERDSKRKTRKRP